MTPILIVGAGPTGLSLALALLQQGIRVRIIDEKTGPSVHSKAFGIHARTLEVFAKLGLATTFLQRGIQAKEIIFHIGESRHSFSLDPELLKDTPYPFVLMLPQSETEQILIDEITKWGGKVEWNTQLTTLEGNEALLNTKEKILFNWLVGCDGGKSQVRHLLQLPFKGVELAETFLIVDVMADSDAQSASPHFFFSKAGLVGLIAFKPTLNRLIFPLKRDEKIAEDLQTIKRELLKRGCCDFITPCEIVWFSYFKIHRRMVQKLRVGNCFLAGDAAHIHSPAGGQGMNTSIQDAYNLAWKLSLVIDGNASHELLDSYEKERLPVAKSVLKGTTRFTRFLQFIQKSGFFFLFLSALFLMKTLLKRRIMRALTELSVTYKKNPYIKNHFRDCFWGGPRAGQRAPNVRLTNGQDWFDSLNTTQPVLLLFQPHERLQHPLIKTIVLEDANLMRIYKAKKTSIYFIRPDGVIGYRSRDLKEKEVRHYLHKIFVDRIFKN